MKLRNKKTGESGKLTYLNFEIDIDEKETDLTILLDNTDGECIDRQFYSLDELKKYLDEWEDYTPKEPLIKDEKIRKAIRAWWDMQDKPFKSAHVMLISKNKDLDGLYHWKIFGYIRSGKEKTSTDMEFRTKKLYSYKPHHDYMKEELCGEEEE